MKPKIILIEDRPDNWKNVKPYIQDACLIVESMEKGKITQGEEGTIAYDRMIELLSSQDHSLENLILISDLYLQVKYPESKIRSHYFDNLTEIGGRELHGMHLLLLAIRNPCIKNLLIIPTSQYWDKKVIYKRLRQEADLLNEYELRREIEVNIHQIFTPNQAEETVEFAYSAWEKRIARYSHILVEDFKRIHFEDWPERNKERPGHPNYDQDLPTWKGKIGYTHLFKNNLESFKALYHNEWVQASGSLELSKPYHYSPREFDTNIFVAVMEALGVEVILAENLKVIYLPLFPGIFFLMHLESFLYSIEQTKIWLSGTKNQPSIRIKLKNRFRFESALYDWPGESSRRFHKLLFCKKDILYHYLSDEQKRTLSKNWPPIPKLDSREANRRRRFQKLLDFHFEGSDLILSWERGDQAYHVGKSNGE